MGRKTGYLSLETRARRGAIVFRKGRVLASVDDGGAPLEVDVELLRGCVARRGDPPADRCLPRPPVPLSAGGLQLPGLGRSRPGSSRPGRRAAETLDTGIEVVELLLELASSRDWPGAA